MAKKDYTLYWIIGIGIIVFVYGGNAGWFKSNFSFTPAPEDLVPSPSQPVYSTCSQVCSTSGFSQAYPFVNFCKNSETKITYGYPNQAPLLVCCCYNEATPTPSGTCTETDGGNVPTTPGTTTADGVARTDVCLDETSLTEYWCLSDGTWQGGRHFCDPGQICIQSRSGGYCKTQSWNTGDTVMSGSGTGTVIGGQQGYAEIDLSKYGLATGGNCQLGAQLSVNWIYANDRCVGIMGAQGMLWEFYDSLGLEYSRIDATPAAWTVDLHPRGHILNWDGHTVWRAIAKQNPGNTPDCIINYDYTVRVYIYECI